MVFLCGAFSHPTQLKTELFDVGFVVRDEPRQILLDQSYLSWMSDYVANISAYSYMPKIITLELENYRQYDATFSRTDIDNHQLGRRLKMDAIAHYYTNCNGFATSHITGNCTRAYHDGGVYCRFVFHLPWLPCRLKDKREPELSYFKEIWGPEESVELINSPNLLLIYKRTLPF